MTISWDRPPTGRLELLAPSSSSLFARPSVSTRAIAALDDMRRGGKSRKGGGLLGGAGTDDVDDP